MFRTLEESLAIINGEMNPTDIFLSQHPAKKIGKPDLQFYHDFEPSQSVHSTKFESQYSNTVSYRNQGFDIPVVMVNHGQQEISKHHTRNDLHPSTHSRIKLTSDFHDLDEHNQKHAFNMALDAVAHHGHLYNQSWEDYKKQYPDRANRIGKLAMPSYEIEGEDDDFKNPLGHKQETTHNINSGNYKKHNYYELEPNRAPTLQYVDNKDFVEHYLPLRKNYRNWNAFDEKLKGLDAQTLNNHTSEIVKHIKETPHYGDDKKKEFHESHRKALFEDFKKTGSGWMDYHNYAANTVGMENISGEEHRHILDSDYVGAQLYRNKPHLLRNQYEKDYMHALEMEISKKRGGSASSNKSHKYPFQRKSYEETGRFLESMGHQKHTQMHRLLSDPATIPEIHRNKKLEY